MTLFTFVTHSLALHRTHALVQRDGPVRAHDPAPRAERPANLALDARLDTARKASLFLDIQLLLEGLHSQTILNHHGIVMKYQYPYLA